MLITKTSPVGVDLHIQRLQEKLHTALVDTTRTNFIPTASYKCYGRCYRNKKDNGYVAENYESNSEYKEVYWDDTLHAISFFGITAVRKNEVDVHFVMFADLSKLALKNSTGSTITHRADEELRQLVRSIIGKHSHGFTYQSTELWLENVLREYPGSRRDDRLKAVDMHPVHCFRINLKLLFDENKIC